MEFSVEEMARRLDTVRERMAEAGVDCLLISGIENFSYFVGVPISLYQSRRPWCALIPLTGEPVAVMKEGGPAITLARQGFFRQVEPYRLPVSAELPGLVAKLIKGFGSRRVAAELGLEMRLGLPLLDYQAILERLPGVEVVDGSSIIWSLRMTKSPEEAARQKRACAITSATRAQVWQEVRRGMTEFDVAALWADLMHQAGGEPPYFIYVNSGDTVDLLPSPEKKLEPGETLWLDGGVYIGGYTCDFSRVATLGPASPAQKQLHRDAVEVQQLLLEQIRPGARVADIAQVGFAEIARRGYPNRDTCGHGMGRLINEPPLIAPSDKTVLTPGMTVGVEQGSMGPGGMFIWEDLVQVTDTGYDLFTTEASTLVELDF